MVKLQNLKKFKNCVTSGVVILGCVHHVMFIRAANLPGGEQQVIMLLKPNLMYVRYACTNYVVHEGLEDFIAFMQIFIVLCYDIWCQYRLKSRNDSERIPRLC